MSILISAHLCRLVASGRIHINFINGTQWRDGVPKPADLDFAMCVNYVIR
jgi:hypothetical protein